MVTIEHIRALGGLHDAEVIGVSWSPQSDVAKIILTDLYANFRGCPEFRPDVTGVVEFRSVADIEISSDAKERVTIYDWEIEEADGGFTSNIFLSPGGHIKIKSRTIELIELSAGEIDDYGKRKV